MDVDRHQRAAPTRSPMVTIMGIRDTLRRLFSAPVSTAPTPERENELAASRPALARKPEPCSECGSVAGRGSRSQAQLVAAVGAEVVAYEDEHPDESFWQFGDAIARAHGLGIFDVTDAVLRIKERRDRPRAPRASRKVIAVDDMRLLDLRHLDATPLKLRGVSHYVSEAGRSKHGNSELVLKREPSNPHDSFAVAVYGSGRKLGHVSASRAALLTPLLDQLAFDGYIVAGIVEQVPGRTTQLHVMLPRVPLLRAYLTEQRPLEA